MKKIILAMAIAGFAVAANAAQVAWTNMGLGSYAGDKYLMFVTGQKGATSVSTIAALLDQGKAVDEYAIGGGKVATNGSASQGASASSPVISDQGTYTAFMVLFDAADPVSGKSKYIVLEGGNGGTGYTQTIGASTASVNFIGGNAASMISASTWKSYGSSAAPEPTSAMLMLLGMAGLALKRKRA